jgi:hypothetical protein
MGGRGSFGDCTQMTGNWRLETGNLRRETGDLWLRSRFPVSSFQFPVATYITVDTLSGGLMQTLPEYTWILALVGLFLAVFVVAQLVARAGGYKE